MGEAPNHPVFYLLLAALSQPCSPVAGDAAFPAPFVALHSGPTAPEAETDHDSATKIPRAGGGRVPTAPSSHVYSGSLAA